MILIIIADIAIEVNCWYTLLTGITETILEHVSGRCDRETLIVGGVSQYLSATMFWKWQPMDFGLPFVMLKQAKIFILLTCTDFILNLLKHPFYSTNDLSWLLHNRFLFCGWTPSTGSCTLSHPQRTHCLRRASSSSFERALQGFSFSPAECSLPEISDSIIPWITCHRLEAIPNRHVVTW